MVGGGFYKKWLKKIIYFIGGEIPKDLPKFNFISICSEKNLNKFFFKICKIDAFYIMSYDNNNVIITILKNELIKVSPKF